MLREAIRMATGLQSFQGWIFHYLSDRFIYMSAADGETTSNNVINTVG